MINRPLTMTLIRMPMTNSTIKRRVECCVCLSLWSMCSSCVGVAGFRL